MAQLPVGVDEHIDPAHKHPEGALCAAGGFYPPLQSVWETVTIHRTALSRQLAGGFLPYNRGGKAYRAYSKILEKKRKKK